MEKGPVSSYSLKWSCVLHGIALLLAIILPLIHFFHFKEKEVPSDFTVVLDENLVEQNVPTPAPSPEPEPTPPAPAPNEPEPKSAPAEEEPAPEPEAPPPAALPEPPKDALVIEKKKPKPKKPPEKKPPEKKVETPTEKKASDKKTEKTAEKKTAEKKTFVKGKRVDFPAKPAQPRFEDIYKPYDPSKPVSVKPTTDKMLSRGDIEKALGMGAVAGTKNSIPEDEASRCFILVRRAMYDAWDQPGKSDAGSRPALLEVHLDLTGRVVSYKISQSSGSGYCDQTVLKAAAKVAAIRGLSLAFLKQYDTLTVEFKLE